MKKSTYFKLFAQLSFFLLFSLGLQAQTVETFNTPGSGTFTVPAGVTEITVETWGGGGGVLTGTLSVSPGQTFSYTVGNGGAGAPGGTNNTRGANGQNSVFGSFIATGGGDGGIGENSNNAGGSGGSGGGRGGAWDAGTQSPGSGVAVQGFAGGISFDEFSALPRAGAGGAGAVGANAINEHIHFIF